MNAKTLFKKLLDAKIKYYKDGNSPLSDKEYDELIVTLKSLDDTLYSKILDIDEDTTHHWKKEKHQYEMGSLNKCNTDSEFKDWSKKYNEFGFYVQEKLDGISIALTYGDGELVKAVTRGNGITGENIIRNVIKMKGVPNTISSKEPITIRGEIVLKHSDWEKLPPEKKGKNPRNTAAGASKKLDGELCRFLSVIVYEVMPYRGGIDNFLFLEKGFECVNTSICETEEDVIKVYNEYCSGKRSELDWDIDGLVIKPEKTYHDIGDWKYPKITIAWKFPHQSTNTVIEKISWQTSGERVNPIAHFTPVEIGGVLVSKASLHNWKFIEELGIREQAKVEVTRRNDVIPHVEGVIELPPKNWDIPVPVPPKECPCCGGKVEFAKNIDDKEMSHLICTNPTCPAKVVKNVMKWFMVHDCKGVAEKTVELIYDNIPFSNLYEFFRVCFDKHEDILKLDGMGNKKIENLHEQLNSTKDTTIEKFLAGLNISNFGTRMFKRIVDFLKEKHDVVELSKVIHFILYDNLGDVEGFNVNTSTTLKKYLNNIHPLIVNLEKIGIKCQPEKAIQSDLKGVSFCFTGAMNTMKRKDAESMVSEKGGVVKSGVAKGLNYLVTNDPDSGSSKNKKAKQVGTKIITEQQFIELIGD